METKEILKQLRNTQGLTMQEFCEKSNINFSTYQNYETGKRLPTAEILMKIADFYDVTTDYLLGREPLPDPFADLNLNKDNEKDVIEKYMSLSDETRAVLLDILIQLGEAAKGKQQIHNDIQQDRMITKKIVAFGGNNIEREVSEDEIIRRFEALEEERRKK